MASYTMVFGQTSGALNANLPSCDSNPENEAQYVQAIVNAILRVAKPTSTALTLSYDDATHILSVGGLN